MRFPTTLTTLLAVALVAAAMSMVSPASAQVDMGSQTLSGNSFQFRSTQWQTELEVVTGDSGVSSLTLDVSAAGVSDLTHEVPSSASSLLTVDGDGNLVLSAMNEYGSDGGGGASPAMRLLFAPRLLVALCACLALVRVVTSPRDGRNSAFLLVACLAVFVAQPLLSSAQLRPVYRLRLRVPASMSSLSNFDVDIPNGRVTTTNLVADSISIDLCGNSNAFDSALIMYSPTVHTSMSICARNYVGVQNVRLGTDGVQITAESDAGLVEISSEETFAGSYDVNAPSGQVTIRNSMCTDLTGGASSLVDTCAPGTSVLTINAQQAYLTLGPAALTMVPVAPEEPPVPDAPGNPCSAENDDVVIESASVSDSWENGGAIAALTKVSPWFVTNEWGQGQTAENDKGETYTVYTLKEQGTDLVFRDRPWGADLFYFVTNPDVLKGAMNGLAKDNEYTFTMNIKQAADNRFRVQDPNNPDTWDQVDQGQPGTNVRIDLLVADNLDLENKWRWLTGANELTWECSTCKSIYTETIYNGQVGTDFMSTPIKSKIFTSNANYENPQVLIRVQFPGRADTHSEKDDPQGNTWTLRGITMERRGRARSFGSLITKSAELVDVPVPADIPSSAKTNCPHLGSGLKRWSESSTWGGSVPKPNGSRITLPENTKVLVLGCDLDAGTYGTIVIPESSELIFGDSPTVLTVQNIVVHGHLWMGSPTCRLNSQILITFDHDAENMPNVDFGRKGIAVTYTGSIDMHGKLFHRTWSRLAASAQIGDDRVVLQDDVNWEVGQQVVISTTIWNDWDTPQNELMTIKAIQGRRVQFTETLKYYHYAGQEYQAEVGLISRRIVLQGDERSEDARFGGHLLSNGKVARISGVLGYRMGQRNQLARYPFHFHLMGVSRESYITDCAVWHSYYRAVTVHGTNETLVARNVVYDITGHAFYLEDGVEEGNSFEYNLGMYIKPITAKDGVPTDFSAAGGSQSGITVATTGDLLIPADIAPSTFYNTNANNSYIGNAASGGFAGFSFVNLPKPIGDHATVNTVPMNRPLGNFYGNSAHSAGWQWSRGACIYFGGMLTQSGGSHDLSYNVGRVARNTEANGEKAWMVLKDTRVFICQRGVNHWGDRARIINFEAHECTRGATTFGESSVEHALLVTESSNPLSVRHPSQSFQFYDTWVKTILYDVTYRNIHKDPGENDPHKANYALISMTHSDRFKPQGISASAKITYENVESGLEIGHLQRGTGASRQYNFVDWDGSATHSPFGSGNPVIVGANDNEQLEVLGTTLTVREWWKLSNNCKERTDWNVWTCPKSTKQEIANIEIMTPGGIFYVNEESPKTAGLMSKFGFSGSNRRSILITNNPGITGVTGDGWVMALNKGAPKELKIACTQIPRTPDATTYVVLAVRYPASAQFEVTTTSEWRSNAGYTLSRVSSVSELMSDTEYNKYAFVVDGQEGWLMLKLINGYLQLDGWETRWFEREGVRIYDILSTAWAYNVKVTSCSGCSGSGDFYNVDLEAVPPAL